MPIEWKVLNAPGPEEVHRQDRVDVGPAAMIRSVLLFTKKAQAASSLGLISHKSTTAIHSRTCLWNASVSFFVTGPT